MASPLNNFSFNGLPCSQNYYLFPAEGYWEENLPQTENFPEQSQPQSEPQVQSMQAPIFTPDQLILLQQSEIANGREDDPSLEESAERIANLKPFICPVETCLKRYRFKGDLKFHVQHKHLEINPNIICRPRSEKEGKDFPCPLEKCICGYRWLRDLKRHIKMKHMEEIEAGLIDLEFL